jgi:hypothetical protein
MQQAFQALRVISEAQTVQIVLAARPDELILKELSDACAGLQSNRADGLKTVILDFVEQTCATSTDSDLASLASARAAVRLLPQPVLAVVRSSLSTVACRLLAEADFTLVASEALLYIPKQGQANLAADEEQRVGGLAAVRLGHATWSASAGELHQELERILDLLRTKSALALRQAKAAVRLTQPDVPVTPEMLNQITRFYLTNVIATEDAQEGLQAFLQKRQPRWANR